MYGNRFVVTTNHESLKYFCDQQDLKGRKARWADLIQDFDFSIRYRKGSMNIVADALSPDIHNYVTKCHQCQVNKAERLKAVGLLHPLDMPNNKWESILMTVILRNTGQELSLELTPPPHC